MSVSQLTADCCRSQLKAAGRQSLVLWLVYPPLGCPPHIDKCVAKTLREDPFSMSHTTSLAPPPPSLYQNPCDHTGLLIQNDALV